MKPLATAKNAGFTLVEMVLVIVLLAVMSSLVATRFGAFDSANRKEDLRRFVNVWELLAKEAKARGESYRLIINFDEASYHVKREVLVDENEARQVDYLENFRTESEKKRRREEREEKTRNIEEEFKSDQDREAQALENIFYNSVFSDPYANYRLGIPTEFPRLAEPQKLRGGLTFRDVILAGKIYEEGEAQVRFSANGAREFAVVHLLAGEAVTTLVINPGTGRVEVHEGDKEFQWTLGKDKS